MIINAPNRHYGKKASECDCGLVHDDECGRFTHTYVDLREEIMRMLGEKCSNRQCRWKNEDGTFGCNDLRMIDIDHVYENGIQDRLTARGHRRQPTTYLRRILDKIVSGSDEFQLLCANCHRLKTKRSYKKKLNDFLKKSRIKTSDAMNYLGRG
jgi:hypothetical protein